MTRRILHVVGGMNRGGVETWLMHVVRHLERDRFRMDFLVHTTQPCAYDDEVRALGARILPCLHPSRPLTYARNFKQILRAHGPYDVVHSHVHHYSGVVLWLASQAGVPVRIAHSHNDIPSPQGKAQFFRHGYLRLTRHWINRFATAGLAASRRAASSLFGANWDVDPRWRLLFCGIDLLPFRTTLEPAVVRDELGILPDTFVIGHVGRFTEQKNHTFLVDIAAIVARRDPKVQFLLAGDGPLRSAIARQVAEVGLDERVIFTGLRSDVPRLMLGAMDLFLFPSLFEGLGLALVEAQAAGLPCVCSDVIPEEADVVKPLVRRLSLSQPASVWAAALLASRDTPRALAPLEALTVVAGSPFDIRTSVRALERVYCGRDVARTTT